jgi:uncharacterized membrane protein
MDTSLSHRSRKRRSAHGTGTPNPLVDLVRSLETDRDLDDLVDRLRPWGAALVADPVRRDLLRGIPAGHAVHPPLTDVPIGLWTAASVLDLVGGEQSRPAARRLIGLGILVALPAAVTGLAEWTGATREEQRVGVVHAAVNVGALSLYVMSWRARRKEHHRRGTLLALAGAGSAGVGGFLGGHLVSARKVSSRHPAFE